MVVVRDLATVGEEVGEDILAGNLEDETLLQTLLNCLFLFYNNKTFRDLPGGVRQYLVPSVLGGQCGGLGTPGGIGGRPPRKPRGLPVLKLFLTNTM